MSAMTRGCAGRGGHHLLGWVLCGILIAGCQKSTPEAQEEEPAVAHGPHGGVVVALRTEAVSFSGIEARPVGAERIDVTVELPGEVKLNAEEAVQVRPTYSGVVRRLLKQLGEPVHRGEVVAVIHSNESLSDYELSAPMSGRVVRRDAAVGQSVDASTPLYSLANLSSVWVDFPIYADKLGVIRPGQRVRIRTESGSSPVAQGTVRYVGPILDQDTRTSYGRVVLDNRRGQWQPGLLVTVVVTLEQVTAPIAVPEDAIVRMTDGPAVFRAVSDSTFEVQPITRGRSDGRVTEITSGLEPGALVVVRNAFLLRAELGKAEAGDED